MFTRHAMTSSLLAACGALLAPAAAHAQADDAPAPLAVGVLSRGVDTHPARDALNDVLARSPNVDVRSDLSVAAAYRATFGPRPHADLSAEAEDAAAFMAKGALEGLLVLTNVEGVLVVEALGPDGRVLGVTRHDDITPDDASARAIVRAAFDRIGPVTLAWRAFNAPRGAARASAPAPAPALTTAEPAVASGGSEAGVSASATPAPRSAGEPWSIVGGVLTSVLEIDDSRPGLLLGADFEFARAHSGDWGEDTGLAFGLTIAPPQADVTMIRADMRAYGVALEGATFSPEVVFGGHAQWRDTPQTRGFFSFGPMIGGGLGVRGGLGTLRLHVTGALDISPGYGLGLVWDARLQADIELGDGFILSPRSVRRATVIAFMERPETTMITWENDVLFGVRF
jgi:hypothetical protein